MQEQLSIKTLSGEIPDLILEEIQLAKYIAVKTTFVQNQVGRSRKKRASNLKEVKKLPKTTTYFARMLKECPLGESEIQYSPPKSKRKILLILESANHHYRFFIKLRYSRLMMHKIKPNKSTVITFDDVLPPFDGIGEV